MKRKYKRQLVFKPLFSKKRVILRGKARLRYNKALRYALKHGERRLNKRQVRTLQRATKRYKKRRVVLY